ncbi:hypothetical protein FB451DRAFT_1564189 [Mycena latifolia]|nr:hypothetical protein FB451DRAFT_1564189 [Mycena latifolia]
MTPELRAQLDEIKPGPVNKLNRPSLLIVAEALELAFVAKGPDKTQVKDLKWMIAEAIKAPKFLFREEFQKFVVYTRAESAAPKTSADKAKQDNLQGKSDAGPPGGAHKKLLDKDVRTDPPPQFRILGQKQDGKDLVDSDDESSSSAASSPSPTPKSLGKTSTAASPNKNEKAPETNNLPIIVKFSGTGSANNQEVWIPPADRSRISVTKAGGQGGSRGYFTSLKALLPLAIEQASPIKNNKKAKIGIAGATGSHVNLGTVEQFTTGPLPAILDLAIDNFELREIPVGLLCDVSVTSTSAPSDASLNSAQADANPFGPDSKPIEVAQQRAASKQALKDADETPIIKFLRVSFDGPKQPRPQLKTVGQMLERYQQHEKSVKFATDHWSDGPNSFRVPLDHDSDFRGVRFGTKDILAALRMKNTSQNNDSHLFRLSRLRHDGSGQAEEWVDKPGTEELKKKFYGMTIKQWNEYLDNAKEEKEEEERKQAREGQKKRKRRDKEEVDRVERKKPKKAKNSEEPRKRKDKHSSSRRKASEEAGPSRTSRGGSVDSDDIDKQ